MTKSSPPIWHYVVSVKSTVKISSILVALLENTNFTIVGALGFAETGTILDTYKVFLVAIQERRR